MAKRAEAPGQPSSQSPEDKRCVECGVKLSRYNPNPTCWRHTIGHPYRGPTAKPKY